MLSDRCLSVRLSLCDVGVLWPNGWMDSDATWYGGRPRPGDIVLDRVPAPVPKRGALQPPIFGICIVAKRLDGSICHLVRR